MTGNRNLKGLGSKSSSINGSVFDVRSTCTGRAARKTDWASSGIEKFIALVNEAGVKIRIEHFQVLKQSFLLKTIIALLVHFKLLDDKDYPNGELMRNMRPDIFITDRNGKAKEFFYDASLEKFYHELKPMFPEDFNLPYMMFIRPHCYSEHIKAALCHLGEMCDFIKKYVPVLEGISSEVSSQSQKNMVYQEEILEMEVEINDIFKDRAKLSRERSVILQELEIKEAELANMLEMKIGMPDELQGLCLESEQNLCKQLTEKMEFSMKVKEKLIKSNELAELKDELSKKKAELLQLVTENGQAQIKVTELECADYAKAYDDLFRVDGKCLEFISSKETKKMLKKFMEHIKKARRSGVVHPELPTVPSTERERVPKCDEETVAALTKLIQEKDQEKRKLEAKIAEAKKWSGIRIHPNVKKLGNSDKRRGRINSEE